MSFSKYKIFFHSLILLFITVSVLSAQPTIRLSDVSWEFKNVAEGTTVQKNVVVSNVGTESLTVNFRVTCDCIEIIPSTVEIPPKQKKIIGFNFYTQGYRGSQTRYVYVETNDNENSVITMLVRGEIVDKIESNVSQNEDVTKISAVTKSQPKKSVNIKKPTINPIILFGPTNCKFCLETEHKIIPSLLNKYNVNIKLQVLPLDDSENYEKLRFLETKFGKKNNKVPVLFIGTDVLYGKDEISKSVDALILKYKDMSAIPDIGLAQYKPDDIKPKIVEQYKKFGLLPIIAAGLLDGINPCAFAVIVFFITYLIFFLNRTKTEVFLTGLSFIIGVFIAYFLLGIGLGKVLGNVIRISVVAKIFYIVTGAVMFVFSLYSFRDAAALKKLDAGEKDKVMLQLPDFLKRFIHDIIRKQAKLRGFVIIALITGFIVSFLELACTGQIYLPTILYIMQVSQTTNSPNLMLNATFMLLLYCFMFVLPLIIIFALIYFGVTSENVRKTGYKYMSAVKILIGFLLLFFGLYMLWTGLKL